MSRRQVKSNAVFLNIPYDKGFESVYLAYIAGISRLGLTPHVTLGIPGGENRLTRIFDLIRSCRYSIHDLSRVELDRTHPPTPRFNMPFELGLAVAWSKLHPAKHTWFGFESMNRRAQKSISDLNGTDFYVHNGRPEDVMRELCNAFVRETQRPTVSEMMDIYRLLTLQAKDLVRETGANSVYEARIFSELAASAALVPKQ